MIFFSSKTNAFYLEENKENYQSEGTWPDDVVNVSFELFSDFSGTPPEGMSRTVGKSGLPEWQPTPALAKEQLFAIAKQIKQSRIYQTNNFINNKQWPGKSTLGRLKKEELVQYNLWLDYLDALEAIDNSNAPDIEWPTAPNQ